MWHSACLSGPALAAAGSRSCLACCRNVAIHLCISVSLWIASISWQAASCIQWHRLLKSEPHFPSSSSLRLVQAVRGWLGRKWYRQLRRRLPPQDSRLRSKWAAEQLQVGGGAAALEVASGCASDAAPAAGQDAVSLFRPRQPHCSLGTIIHMSCCCLSPLPGQSRSGLPRQSVCHDNALRAAQKHPAAEWRPFCCRLCHSGWPYSAW